MDKEYIHCFNIQYLLSILNQNLGHNLPSALTYHVLSSLISCRLDTIMCHNLMFAKVIGNAHDQNILALART